MDKQLDSVGLLGDPRVEYFAAHRVTEPGRFYSAGARGCFSSHRQVLVEALAAGESVLVLEDDCDFTAAIHSYEPPAEWDVFYGGFEFAADPNDLQRCDIVGAHCMGFRTSALEKLLPWLEAAWNGDDPAPIDGEYVRFRRAHPEVVTVFAEPLIAVQRPSRTDIGTQRFFDKVVGLREVAEIARKVRRAFKRR